MPSDPESGAALCEKFVRESREIDLAFLDGTLQTWVAEKLVDERKRAEDNPSTLEAET